jgi:hypothetical protein
MAGVPVLSEKEYSRYLQQERIKIVEFGDRMWRFVAPGMVQPLHLLAGVPAQEFALVSRKFLGVQARSLEGVGNGSIPLHLLRDLQNFSPSGYSSVIRRHLKRARKEFFLETDQNSSERLLEEYYRIYRSANERNGRKSVQRDVFLKSWYRRLTSGSGYFLYCREQSSGQVVGFLWGVVIQDAGYLHTVAVDSSYMSFNINALLVDGMLWSFRSAGVRWVSMGQHFREKPGIVEYKRRLAFPVVKLPAFTKVWRPLELAMKIAVPDKLYRFRGYDECQE